MLQIKLKEKKPTNICFDFLVSTRCEPTLDDASDGSDGRLGVGGHFHGFGQQHREDENRNDDRSQSQNQSRGHRNAEHTTHVQEKAVTGTKGTVQIELAVDWEESR